MGISDDTDIGGYRRSFPTTHWTLLHEVRDQPTEEHREALNILTRLYWKPVYCFLRSRGFDNEETKDLVQEFFTPWLQKKNFGHADQSRGRFRSFLLSSLKDFLSNVHRAQHAKARRPEAGFVSIHELSSKENMGVVPVEKETPEAPFIEHGPLALSSKCWVR